MRKIQILGLSLVAVFAFSAIVASMASAEATLLAEWLVGGAQFKGALTIETKGSILLEDTVFKIGVVCKGVIVGTVTGESSGVDSATEVLNTAGTVKIGEKLAGTALECERSSGCETSSTPLIWVLNMPWTTLAYLLESGGFADHVFGEAGYEVECTVLLSKISEECKSASSTGTGGEVLNVATGVEATEEELLPAANCTTGGTGAGANLPLAGNLTSVSGAVLSVSSE